MDCYSLRDEEPTVTEDMTAVARQLIRYVTSRGASLVYHREDMLAKVLLKYLRLRKSNPTAVWRPRRTPQRPEEWTKKQEEIWQNWLTDTFVSWEWVPMVMEPIFGTDVRSWEPVCGDWRADLWHMLSAWVQPSWEIVDRHDPEGGIEWASDEEEGTKGVDPYLLDHGGRRRR